MKRSKPGTRLRRHSDDAVNSRDQSLVDDLFGRRTFTDVMCGFVLMARAAGPVAPLAEEEDSPAAAYIRDLVDREIPFEGDPAR